MILAASSRNVFSAIWSASSRGWRHSGLSVSAPAVTVRGWCSRTGNTLGMLTSGEVGVLRLLNLLTARRGCRGAATDVCLRIDLCRYSYFFVGSTASYRLAKRASQMPDLAWICQRWIALRPGPFLGQQRSWGPKRRATARLCCASNSRSVSREWGSTLYTELQEQ